MSKYFVGHENLSAKERWAKDKIITSKTRPELKDEFERGCNMFASKNQCGRCSNCPLQKAHDMMDFLLNGRNNVYITINGDVNIKF